MNFFLLNLLLALIWAMATSLFNVTNLLAGMVLSYLILWFINRRGSHADYFRRVPRVVRFTLFYIGQLILSNLRVAYDVVTPTHYMKPAVIAVPLDAQTDIEIVLLANLITLTPGSLSLDVSPDRRTLFVHVMYVDNNDLEAARHKIKDTLERRVLQVLR